jgi:lipoprotein-anchoring transpeptidase ErfK/SrfK
MTGMKLGVRQGTALAAAVALALAVAGCQGDSGSDDAKGSGASASSAPAAKAPALSLSDKTSAVSYRKAVKITVADGTLASMQVGTTKGEPLEGDVAAGGASWSSQSAPRPGARYRATAVVKDSAGKTVNKTLDFTVAPVPADQKLAFTVTPDDGETVGIGQPIVVHFLTPVTKKAAVERAMTVAAKTPSGADVTGSWHWVNTQQIDWRPKEFWEPGTEVGLDMKIAGIKSSSGHYGRKDYTQRFTIGDSHVTRVDAKSDRVKVYRDGKLVHTWPTGTGKKGLETYSGTYVVLNKSKEIEMDSCSARITCDKKDPDYYSEKERWATRITASGTFLHAASWDGLLGRANTSHGCVHLSDADAKEFYNHAVPGDVVIVKNTGRGPQERIATQDPGLYDWNLSWSKWKAGSAL